MALITETTDAPSTLSSDYTLTVGDSFAGDLIVDDLDVIRIDLVQGTSYTFDLTAGSMSDPYLTIISDSGNILLENDDIDDGVNLSSSITFTANYTGAFYLELTSSSMIETDTSNDIGSYTLTTQSNGVAPPLPIYSYEQIADYILTTGWDRTTPIGYNIDVGDGSTSNDTIKVNITKLTADGQFLATKALEAWTLVSGIQFEFVSSGEQMDFDDNQAGAFAGWSSIGSNITSSYVNVSTGWLASNGTTIGSYSFQTYVHEIGHAMGLAHSGPYDGSANYGIDNIYQNDSWQATIMSYFSQTENFNIDADYAIVVTPMIADILAIKELYGDAGDLRVGDTVYGVGSTAGGYYDDLINLTSAFAFTIFDDGGTDTIDFSSDTNDQVVNLNDREVSDVFGVKGNMVIADGTIVENFVSGSGDDLIFGNEVSNSLNGSGGADMIYSSDGDDELYGGTGNDRLVGEQGNDSLYGGSGNDIIKAKAGNDYAEGGAGDDKIIGDDTGAEVFYGGSGVDIVAGLGGSDNVYGDANNDFIYGGRGNDFVYGGTGDDIVRGNRNDDKLFGGDGVDREYGGGGNDSLFGGSEKDYLLGENGNDTLDGGIGDDNLTGGSGNDVFVFKDASYGYDRIKDFEVGVDKVDLTDFGLGSFTDVETAATDVGAGVKVVLNSQTLLIEGVTEAELVASDFLTLGTLGR